MIQVVDIITKDGRAAAVEDTLNALEAKGNVIVAVYGWPRNADVAYKFVTRVVYHTEAITKQNAS